LIGLPCQNIQTHHNQPSGGWDLAELAGGWKGGYVLLARLQGANGGGKS
jgi:hypothetical protein